MAEEKKLAKQPMLYIVQPKSLKPAEVPMQTSFRTQRQATSNTQEEKKEPSAKETPSTEREVRLRRQSPHREELAKLKLESAKSNEELAHSEIEAERDKQETNDPRVRRQRFHDMNLEEKVNYFFNLSPHVPKMKCEVTTEEEQYRGYITNYQEGIVHMKVFQRPFHREIDFQSIKDIRLLGF